MLYRLVRWLLRLLFLPLGLKGEGLENIPADGPVILAANHVSMWDPVMVGLAVHRTINFMAKEELFRFKPFGWLIKQIYAFPVKRGTADTGAIKHSLGVLKNGQVLGIFPEGTRKRGTERQKPHPGMALFALRTGTPVVPIAVHGTTHGIVCGWIWPLKVVAGEPLHFSSEQYGRVNSAAMEEVSEIIMDRICELE